MTDSVTVWRLNTRLYARTALSGEGAHRRGGRWNLPGTRVVYCSASRALAALEALVHVEDTELLSSITWLATAITLPATGIECPRRYPPSWRTYPYSLPTQKFGSDWVRSGRSVALRVPSAVVPGEFNYLLNPAHPHFAELTFAGAAPFRFDSRLTR